MTIEFDQDKRDKTLSERGLDFRQAPQVLSGPVLTFEDTRADYGEKRIVTYGLLDGKMVVLVWTKRGESRRIISMRYANEREKSRYGVYLG